MFTKDTLLADAFGAEGANADAIARALEDFGMRCFGCALARGETLGEAAAEHGIDVDLFVDTVNEAAESPVE